ncbi:MAG TPA: septum site-determining protein MinC [Kofleriaceae bacterium]|nr:septum site-determining protein MinC [Kofleriaceae bacterium]
MDPSIAVQDVIEPMPEEAGPAAVLRGTARGLEIVVDATAATSAITAAVTKRLEEAPGFFRGSDVRVRVEEGPLAPGCLARLDDLALQYELRIVEVTAQKRRLDTANDADAVPVPESLAAGSAPSPADFGDESPTNAGAKLISVPPAAPEIQPAALIDIEDVVVANAPELSGSPETFDEPTQTAIAAPLTLASLPDAELATHTPGTRIVIGPVRSGVILDHTGHVVVFGDVNPGAEVRAAGNIVVLGRLRGTAHAGIGQDVGFILALRLEPQQLRIGRQVARAADSETPGTEPELAYGTGDKIIVERYQGKLPRNLATSI